VGRATSPPKISSTVDATTLGPGEVIVEIIIRLATARGGRIR